MAEALINQLGHGRHVASSAGSSPAGYVHPKAIETLRRHGIDPGTPRSKSWDVFANERFDLVITVCDQAAGESCPLFAGSSQRLHWSIADPANVQGTPAEIDAAFEHSLSLLKTRIEGLLK
jgi:arsenate reductase